MLKKLHTVVLAGVILCVSISVSAGDKKQGCKALKGIVHLSDNYVRFHSKEGVTVFVDPVTGPEDSLVTATGMTRADLILITHPHNDHFRPEVLKACLKANPDVVIAGPVGVVKLAAENGIDGVNQVAPNQRYEFAGVTVETLPAYFSKGDSHPKSNHWVGYVIQLNGLRYYVTGDTEPVPEMAESGADVIFPLLYGCGGNLESALKMVKLSKAPVVVPVHTGGNMKVIKKFLGSLPEDVQGACYLEGKLVSAK